MFFANKDKKKMGNIIDAIGLVHPVMTVPYCMKNDFNERCKQVGETYTYLKALFRSARENIRIFVPYVDPTITSLLSEADARIMVVTTTKSSGRNRGNSVLERLKVSREMLVRYLIENRRGSSIFQVHAKMFIVDNRVCYIGSANLTDTSLHYNLELGVMLAEKDIIRQLSGFFDLIFENYSVPLELL